MLVAALALRPPQRSTSLPSQAIEWSKRAGGVPVVGSSVQVFALSNDVTLGCMVLCLTNHAFRQFRAR